MRVERADDTHQDVEARPAVETQEDAETLAQGQINRVVPQWSDRCLHGAKRRQMAVHQVSCCLTLFGKDQVQDLDMFGTAQAGQFAVNHDAVFNQPP
jgi:hypothetical protein